MARPIELVDVSLQHLVEVLGAQWVNFLRPDTNAEIQRCTFNRFIISDWTLSFGLWQWGDEINLHFLTNDNENRWAEVVAEALGVEVGSKELREATKNCVFDLTDERLCRFRDGRRTQYWYLRHANEGKCRIRLHYVRIAPEWLGDQNIGHLMQEASKELLPQWPRDLPVKSYTKNLRRLADQQLVSQRDECAQYIRTVYPIARIWTTINNLWAGDLINAEVLILAVAAPLMQGRYGRKNTEEQMLVSALKAWSAGLIFDYIEPNTRDRLQHAATLSLRDLDQTMANINEGRSSQQPFRQDCISPSDLPTKKTPAKTDHSTLEPVSTAPRTPGQKLRDARSALNRLRHDGNHADISYDVGYADRFEGMKWMPLEKWGGKGTEEEDFVPEHRVKKIVRAKDGAVVWDREGRVDRTGETG